MITAILIVVTILSITIWERSIQDSTMNFQIPESSNITHKKSSPVTPSDIINQIDGNYGNPTLLYIYTTWCGICKQQMPVVNEIARKFQNTDLKVISVAIDKNIDAQSISKYLEFYKNIYSQPQYLTYNDGLADLLKQKNIKYNKIIPLTVLIDRQGEIALRFTGYKNENSVSKKIIKTLIENDKNI